MQTSAHIIATVCHAELVAIIEQLVRGDQSGFVAGRVMGDNISMFTGAMLEFSILAGSLPACILLDFAQAFPSFLHVQRDQGSLQGLAHDGASQGPVALGQCRAIQRGIKQGCPVRG